MAQKPSTPNTRYEVVTRPPESAGYTQRIPMWEAIEQLGSVNRSELLTELRKTHYARPNGALLDEAYCRIELTDMTKKGYLRRVSG